MVLKGLIQRSQVVVVIIYSLCTGTLAVSSESEYRYEYKDDHEYRTEDVGYLNILPEDPLQPVWNNLDAIPAQVLDGFRRDIDTLSGSIESSLTVVRSSLLTMEEDMKERIESLGEEVSEFLTDRLVNTETVILDGINKLTETQNHERDNRRLDEEEDKQQQEEEEPRLRENQVTEEEEEERQQQPQDREQERREEDRCLAEATAMTSKVGEVLARVEDLTRRMDSTARSVEEALAKVEEMGRKVDEGTAKMEDVAERVIEAVERKENETQQRNERETNTNASHEPLDHPEDCSDIHNQRPEANSGVYLTYPTEDKKTPVKVFCDMGNPTDRETGGWTVILRRQNTSYGLENFNRTWAEYREGFGRVGEGEWWYGLAHLHYITSQRPYEALFLLHDIELGTFTARYSTLRVGGEDMLFPLAVGTFSGNVSYDALKAMHHGRPFSTYDRDNDNLEAGSCAASNGGGWWYNRCHKATLTAVFPRYSFGTRTTNRNARTIRWFTPKAWLVLDDVTVKIRPVA